MIDLEFLKLIKEELSFFPQGILKKGRDLARNGIISIDEIGDGDGYHFDVSGNEQYTYEVEVFAIDYDILEYTCECVYFESNDCCKHIAAALIFLVDQHSKPIHKPKGKPAQPTILKQPIRIDTTGIKVLDKSMLLPYRASRGFYGLVIAKALIKPEKLILTIENEWGEGLRPVDSILEISQSTNCITISCSDPNHKHNCEHISLLISFVESYNSLNLLEEIKSDNLNQKVNQMLDNQKIALKKGENIWDLIEVSIDESNLKFYGVGRLKGLTDPATIIKFINEKFFDQFNTFEKKLALFGPKTISENQQTRGLGLLWEIDIKNQKLINLDLISGNLSKDSSKLISYIERESNPFGKGFDEEIWIETFNLKEKIGTFLKTGSSSANEKLNTINRLGAIVHQRINYIYSPHYITFGDANIRKTDLTQVTKILSGLKLKFHLSYHDDIYSLEASLVDDQGQNIMIDQSQKLFNPGLLLLENYNLGLFASPKDVLAFSKFASAPVIRVTAANFLQFYENSFLAISKEFPVEVDEGILDFKKVTLEPKQKRLYISELNQYVIFKPVLLYENDHEMNVLEQNTLVDTEDGNLTIFETDKLAEQQYLEEVAAFHPSFSAHTQQSFFHLSFNDFQKGHWFLKVFEEARKRDIHVFGFDKLKSLKFSPFRASVSLGFKSGEDWFETQLSLAFGNNKVSLKDLRKALVSGNNFVELKDGTLGILPEEWIEKFSRLFRTADVDKDKVRISKAHFNMLDDLVSQHESPAVFNEIIEKKQRLASFEKIDAVSTPKLLQAKMRDYQHHGLNWLNFLSQYGWGGILADDMGLGKTVQALALICRELEDNPESTVLVVAPTTLLFNWKNEIEKFAPSIKYFVHHGQRNDDHNELQSHQVILTSYGIMMNDIALLKKINFNLVIADESQAIKNLNSKRYKAITQLKGKIRIAMSGTPIENNIYELYAQMNFVNPGFFFGFTQFKDQYGKPLENGQQPNVVEELRKKTKPFILRRTKEQVLKELPPKTEEYLFCEMSPGQRKVYDAYRNEYRNYLLEKFEEEGLEKSQMYVLEGLTRLRQICDSPELIEKEGLAEKASTKLDELVRHVEEKTGKHKILVFSQFVKMLDLIRKRFDTMDISYEYLDGSTTIKERENRVNHFQDDPNCRVFLISLKAGGTGLNLTSADYVYIVDPWWNPAVENQAIDRCYRMGQENKVFAYRMICKDTVEEKIVNLQKRKKALSDDIVGVGEGVMQNLTRQDIDELFS